MLLIRLCALLVCGFALIPFLSGCDDADVVAKKQSAATTPSSSLPAKTDTNATTAGTPVADIAAEEDEPLPAHATFVPMPKLPPGAGEIDDNAPQFFMKRKSGLKYRILRKSDGRKPTAGDQVLAHYKGWLDTGKQFDSSYDRGSPLPFTVKSGPGGVIRGWVEGVQLVG